MFNKSNYEILNKHQINLLVYSTMKKKKKTKKKEKNAPGGN